MEKIFCFINGIGKLDIYIVDVIRFVFFIVCKNLVELYGRFGYEI